MKQNKKQKLALETQTVRSLSPIAVQQLEGVAGGSWPTKVNTQCGLGSTLCGG
jgi:hypothetical protein